MIGPWTEESPGKWFRREDGKPLATVVVGSPAGSLGTTSFDGKPFRRMFPSIEAAKTWCDDVREGREAPSGEPLRVPPPHPLGETRLPPAPPAPPKPPAGPPVERLLRVLRNDPVLAFEVAQKLRILGPWTQEGEDWHQRADAYGYVVATVRGEPKGTEILWRWSTFHHAPAGEEDRTMSGFGSWEEARGACDVHLAGEGWLLVPWTTRTEARP